MSRLVKAVRAIRSSLCRRCAWCAVLVTVPLLGLPHHLSAADWVVNGTFTEAGLLSGHRMAQAECVPESNSIWLVVDGDGECVRYFHAGLDLAGDNPLVHVWLHDDRLQPTGGGIGHRKPTNQVRNYNDRTPELLQASVDGYFATFGVPFIRISRPGTYGSSGDHRERRRLREVEIVNAAIDALKARYRIDTMALSGHAGGGHLVGTLLPRRTDLRCVVITSGNVALAHRGNFEGWRTDTTGYNDSVDPMDLVERIPKIRNRPIILAGDLRDARIRFDSQLRYHQRLREVGQETFMLLANAPPPDYHDLEYLGLKLVRWCLEGRSVADIAQSTKFITGVWEPEKRYEPEYTPGTRPKGD